MYRIAIAFFLLASVPVSAANIVLVAGGGTGGDGSKAAEAKLITPFGVDFDSKGRLYFVEMEKGERLRMIDDEGKIKTVAGTGEKGSSGDQGPPIKATFNGMHGLAIAGDAVYLADTWNNCVRVVYGDRIIQPFAGSGKKGKSIITNGNPREDLGCIFAVAATPDQESLILTDLDNRAVYRIHPGHRAIRLQHIAGNGKKGTPQNGGKAVDEPLADPRAATMDAAGNLYILERNAHSLRVVNMDGIIKTVMGTGKAGTAVGKALESQMNGPKHLCCDKDGSVFIADAENHRILKYDPKTNMVSVVAGTGKKGKAGLDGDPLKCELNRPHGVCVHPKTGELYIVDSYNDRILKITP